MWSWMSHACPCSLSVFTSATYTSWIHKIHDQKSEVIKKQQAASYLWTAEAMSHLRDVTSYCGGHSFIVACFSLFLLCWSFCFTSCIVVCPVQWQSFSKLSTYGNVLCCDTQYTELRMVLQKEHILLTARAPEILIKFTSQLLAT